MESDFIEICKTGDTKIPAKAHNIDAGFDFFVPNDFNNGIPVFIESNHDILIPTHIKVIVPHGYALIAKNKSGVAVKKNLSVGAAVVDEGYTGEVHIHLYNFGKNRIEITPGEKIVQFVLVKIGNHMVKEITEDEYNEKCNNFQRGIGAFGSTGVK